MYIIAIEAANPCRPWQQKATPAVARAWAIGLQAASVKALPGVM